jgi:hypothetical protein
MTELEFIGTPFSPDLSNLWIQICERQRAIFS